MSTRCYAVGVTAVVTIHDEDYVTVDVDLSELSELDPDLAVDPVTPEQMKVDSEILSRWAAFYILRGEGAAP